MEPTPRPGTPLPSQRQPRWMLRGCFGFLRGRDFFFSKKKKLLKRKKVNGLVCITWNHKTRALQMRTWIRNILKDAKQACTATTSTDENFLLSCRFYFEVGCCCCWLAQYTHKVPKSNTDDFPTSRNEEKSFSAFEKRMGSRKHSVSMVFCFHVDVVVVLNREILLYTPRDRSRFRSPGTPIRLFREAVFNAFSLIRWDLTATITYALR